MKLSHHVKTGRDALPVRDRLPLARGLRRRFNEASANAWREIGEEFHEEFAAARFTPEHAAEAGYSLRKGQSYPVGTKRFRQFYYGRKYYDRNRGGGTNRADPLVNTGATRDAILRGTPRIESTRYAVRISYTQARVFNFRHPKSNVRMSDEFRTITKREAMLLASRYDRKLDEKMKNGA